MSLALYRKYRSRSLDDIVGQSQVTEVLRNAIKQGRISHAYLFTGPHGIGKTSIARILAHEINGLPYTEDSSHLDIIEIDAASNNGVDHIRDLRDRAQLAPMSAKRKIYIIDEVHMLSKAAFNALLKTLEEPPEHVVFILATTDVDKLPDTIISRTQRHAFKRASIEDLEKNLTRIVEKEKINIAPEAINLIAQHSNGSYRDSVSLLDQIANISANAASISRADVEQNLGLPGEETVTGLLDAAKSHDVAAVTAQLRELENRGIQARVIVKQLIGYIAEHAPEEPALLPLLDSLLEVDRSSLPEVKLLTVLASFAAPKHTTRAVVAAPAPTISAPIPELAKKAVQKKPRDNLVENAKTAEESGSASNLSAADLPSSTPSGVTKEDVETVGSASAEKTTSGPIPKVNKPKKSSGKVPEPDWKTLLADVKPAGIALYSLLSKCQMEADGEIVTIYAKNPLFKTKFDNVRFKIAITDALNKQFQADWEIVAVASTMPPKDSKVAEIAAIMGGGEEVTI